MQSGSKTIGYISEGLKILPESHLELTQNNRVLSKG